MKITMLFAVVLLAACSELPQPPRYQAFTNGSRSWRLDTRTGKVCVLLSGDWGSDSSRSCFGAGDELDRTTWPAPTPLPPP